MNDSISRQAAIAHLKQRLYETQLNNDTEHPYYEEIADNRIDVWMNEVPSVQPEQKRGKWIERDKYLQYCSRCMYMIRGDASKDIIKEFRYCPNCGAEMEE